MKCYRLQNLRRSNSHTVKHTGFVLVLQYIQLVGLTITLYFPYSLRLYDDLDILVLYCIIFFI